MKKLHAIFLTLLLVAPAFGQQQQVTQATDAQVQAGANVKRYVNPRQYQLFMGTNSGMTQPQAQNSYASGSNTYRGTFTGLLNTSTNIGKLWFTGGGGGGFIQQTFGGGVQLNIDPGGGGKTVFNGEVIAGDFFTLSSVTAGSFIGDGSQLSNLPQLGRSVLTNAFTFYVATNGDDGNDGLTVGTPLLSIQTAVNRALKYDFSTNVFTIQLADGRYEGTVKIGSTASTANWQAKSGFLVLHGNDASPTSVVLTNSATNHLVVAANGARAIVASMYLTSTNRGNECLLDSQFFSYLGFSNVVFGACGANEAQLVAEANGTLEALGPYTISGGGSAHALALGHGTIYIEKSVTFTGTPVFTYSVFRAYNDGSLFLTGPFSGSVTGQKYNLATGGSISTYNNGTVDALPGSSTGSQNISLAENSTNFATLQTTLVLTNILNTNADVDSIRFEKYGANNNGPSVASFHSRGATAGAHGAMTQDDRLFFLGGGGDDGSALQTNKAVMTFNADGTWSGSATPTYIQFATTPAGSTSRGTSFQINSDHTINTYGSNTVALTSITVGASPFTYQNTTGHSEFVFIYSGTITIISVNGTGMSSAGFNQMETIPLQNGESVTVTYSSAPTMKRKPY